MTLGKLPQLSEPLTNGDCACLKGLLEILNDKHFVLVLRGDSGIGVAVVTDSSTSVLPASAAH